MDTYLLSHIMLLGLLLLASMFFSAVETSLLSFPRPLLQSQLESPGILGRAFKEWHDHPNRILTTILLGNNVANVAVTTLAAYMSIHFAEINNWSRAVTGTVVSGTVMAVLIIFGEAIPKVMARTHSAKATPWLVVPIYLFDRFLSPISWVLAHSVALLFPGINQASASLVTEDDIKYLIEMGRESGSIHEYETNMIHSILKFTDTKASEVMVPRTEMFCVDIKTDFDKLLDLVVQNGYSRVPVYKESMDKIVGIIYTRDLLSIWKNKELIVIQDLLRKPYFVPESSRVDRLLREFKRGKVHLAIVVDEYGGTAGLVTLEDLVEEIFGEIQDEHDSGEEKAIAKLADGSWVVEADLALDEVNEALDLHLVPKGEVASLGGYVMEIAGKVPKKGRVIEDREAVFKILDASETSILKIKTVKRKTPLAAQPAEAAASPKPRKKKAKAPSPETPMVEAPTEAPVHETASERETKA